MTEEQAKKTYERALKMEQEFGEYFTGKSTFGHSRRTRELIPHGSRGIVMSLNEC